MVMDAQRKRERVPATNGGACGACAGTRRGARGGKSEVRTSATATARQQRKEGHTRVQTTKAPDVTRREVTRVLHGDVRGSGMGARGEMGGVSERATHQDAKALYTHAASTRERGNAEHAQSIKKADLLQRNLTLVFVYTRRMRGVQLEVGWFSTTY